VSQSSSSSNLGSFIKRIEVRSHLTEQERQAIVHLPVRVVQVKANRDLVRLGERVNHACLIVYGLVGRFGETKEGQRQITALHIPGDMADLHSVVRPVGTSALQALTTTTVLRVLHDDLRAIARQYPAIAEAFWRDCMVDAAILSQWVVNVGRRDAKSRMAHLLCEMASRYANDEGAKLSFDLPMTQQHLADATGLTSVHVNRTLKALREDGVVTITGRDVQVHQWDRLVSLGEFDAAYLQADARQPERLLN